MKKSSSIDCLVKVVAVTRCRPLGFPTVTPARRQVLAALDARLELPANRDNFSKDAFPREDSDAPIECFWLFEFIEIRSLLQPSGFKWGGRQTISARHRGLLDQGSGPGPLRGGGPRALSAQGLIFLVIKLVGCKFLAAAPRLASKSLDPEYLLRSGAFGSDIVNRLELGCDDLGLRCGPRLGCSCVEDPPLKPLHRCKLMLRNLNLVVRELMTS